MSKANLYDLLRHSQTIFLCLFAVGNRVLLFAPNDGFLLNTLKTLFRLSRVLLDL